MVQIGQSQDLLKSWDLKNQEKETDKMKTNSISNKRKKKATTRELLEEILKKMNILCQNIKIEIPNEFLFNCFSDYCNGAGRYGKHRVASYEDDKKIATATCEICGGTISVEIK